jgi:hypothetical protein
MNFPSTNTDGRNPSLGGVVSNVESSHGVLLDGGSTGGIVTAVGDDANIALRVRAKGSAPLILGSTAGGIVFGSTTVPNSTSATFGTLKGIFQSTFTWAHAAISSGQYGEIVLASTTCDAWTGDAVMVSDFAATTNVTIANLRLSTVATSRVTIVLSNVGSSATSTFSGTGTVTWFDLT